MESTLDESEDSEESSMWMIVCGMSGGRLGGGGFGCDWDVDDLEDSLGDSARVPL